MTPLELHYWAIRHHVSAQGMHELLGMFGQSAEFTVAPGEPHSEAYVQNLVRLEFSRKGGRLWRNNVGVLKDETGRPVRYGLANESKQQNEKLKSSDLIGIEPVTVTPEHVGKVIGRFVAFECKAEGWQYTGTPHEEAQASFVHLVNALGGRARFVSGGGQV